MSTRKHATRSSGTSLLKTPTPSPPRVKNNTIFKYIILFILNSIFLCNIMLNFWII